MACRRDTAPDPVVEPPWVPPVPETALVPIPPPEPKIELVKEKGGSTVSCYRQDGFIDFCLGPHMISTGKIKAFKLLSGNRSSRHTP